MKVGEISTLLKMLKMNSEIIQMTLEDISTRQKAEINEAERGNPINL
jgi:hypothetical protein